ncbi:MAG: hypothetical protein ACREFC_15240 [Stellaceae bacterium]
MEFSAAILHRLAGAAAIVGGVLRAIDGFAFKFLTAGDSEQLFLVTDIFLLFGLIGVYAAVARDTGWTGMAGFAAAIVGIVLSRSAGGIIDAYIVGATVCVTGVAVLGASIMARRKGAPAGPVLWILAPILGVVAYAIESDWLFELAGIAFGLGFVLSGVALMRPRLSP